MTPFKEKGWTKDDKFIYTGEGYDYLRGQHLTLKEDDDSSCPLFWLEDKSDYHFIFLSNLTKVSNAPVQPTQPTQSNQEIHMNQVNKIETVVRINGVDASTYSDDQIFDLIARTEKDIEKLNDIGTKPKKLDAKIKAMQESIKELVKIVDARD